MSSRGASCGWRRRPPRKPRMLLTASIPRRGGGGGAASRQPIERPASDRSRAGGTADAGCAAATRSSCSEPDHARHRASFDLPRPGSALPPHAPGAGAALCARDSLSARGGSHARGADGGRGAHGARPAALADDGARLSALAARAAGARGHARRGAGALHLSAPALQRDALAIRHLRRRARAAHRARQWRAPRRPRCRGRRCVARAGRTLSSRRR